jgi:putative AlgH/UPF0301 family transcriptional regulator
LKEKIQYIRENIYIVVKQSRITLSLYTHENIMSRLNRTLKKTLLKTAKRFDRRAAYKALVTNYNYHDMKLCSHLTKFLGPKKRLYVPERSLEEFLRQEIALMVKTDTEMTKRFRLLRQLNTIEHVFERIEEDTLSGKNKDDDLKHVDLKLRPLRKASTRPGTVLVSHPLQLADPSYRRKVMVLLSEDTTNGTSLGVVVNGNRSQTSADRLVSDYEKKRRGSRKKVSSSLDDKTRKLLRKAPVYSGGPSAGVICLHQAPVCDSATLIFEADDDGDSRSDVFYGGDTTKIANSVASGSNEWRFFNGFCRFETSNLRHEIEEGSWIACDAPTDLVMNKNVTWTNALNSMGGEFLSFKDLEDLDMTHFESNDGLGYGEEEDDDDDMFEEDGVF